MKKSNLYCCILCNYSTSESNKYNRHLLTSKHNNVMLVMKKGEKGEKGLNLFKCNMCNKIYKSNNGLWVHKKIPY